MNIDRLKVAAQKLKSYTERNGIKSSIFRTMEEAARIISDSSYGREMGTRQDRDLSNLVLEMEKTISISLLIPVCDPEPQDFVRLLDSIEQQVYQPYEVIICDGGKETGAEAIVNTFANKPERSFPIRYKRLAENLGISGNTNEALSLAEGDFVAFLDHDDFLEPDSLYEIALALQGGGDMVYTDEDKFDGQTYFAPNRKPDYNLDLLLSNNYICHLLTVRTAIVREAGGFRSDYDGAQDHDLLLRLAERIPAENILHIPKVLYHWKASQNSTADNPDSKPYAYERAREAILDYFRRRGIEAEVEDTAHRGFYHVNYSGNEIPAETYKLLLSPALLPQQNDYERRLSSYFIRPEVGLVGGRITGIGGRILCNGYTLDSYGRRVSLYADMNTNFSGNMHRAAVSQDVEAVSRHACVVRSELMDLYCKDTMEFCRRIREKGYLIIIDPTVQFRLQTQRP
ncbi:MAG: glycosyltransferase [Lachnospiraceae bacterium]|nr:glycosyltransferase [Lachnospiraceae bacterium]